MYIYILKRYKMFKRDDKLRFRRFCRGSLVYNVLEIAYVCADVCNSNYCQFCHLLLQTVINIAKDTTVILRYVYACLRVMTIFITQSQKVNLIFRASAPK